MNIRVTIEKRARKYYHARVGKRRAQVVINDHTPDLQPGATYDLIDCNDLSTSNRYGETLRYEPTAAAVEISPEQARREAAAAERAEKIAKYLGYAENDASQGLCRSNAIRTVLDAHNPPEHLADRIAGLRERVTRNIEADQAAKRKREADRAAERAEREAQKQHNRTHRRLYPLADPPAIDTVTKLGDRYIVYTGSGKSFRIDEGAPSIHGSHLYDYEGSMGCYYYFREATDDEIDDYEARQREAQARREARKARDARIHEISEMIRTQGDRPAEAQPEGEVVLDTQNIYGGGDWFIVGIENIWYVRNNGGDGDDWSDNNVRTGGAGAIGWRIPATAELAAELHELHELNEATAK